MQLGPSSSFMVGYAVWWLLPFSLALLSVGNTDLVSRYMQCLAIVWPFGVAGLLWNYRVGAVVSGCAILMALVPSVVYVAGRAALLVNSAEDVGESPFEPIVAVLPPVAAVIAWLVPCSMLLVLWVRDVRRVCDCDLVIDPDESSVAVDSNRDDR